MYLRVIWGVFVVVDFKVWDFYYVVCGDVIVFGSKILVNEMIFDEEVYIRCDL